MTLKRPAKKANRIAAAQAALKRAQDELEAAMRDASPGRPTLYRPEYAARATDLCMLGLSNAELGERFGGADEETVKQWIASVPDFAAAVYAGREGADMKVVAKMFAAATGYSHPEDDIRTVGIGDGMSEIRITPTTRHYPPNYNFANRWMINRQRRRWPARESIDAAGAANQLEDAARAARAAVKAALDDSAPPQEPPAAEGDKA